MDSAGPGLDLEDPGVVNLSNDHGTDRILGAAVWAGGRGCLFEVVVVEVVEGQID